MDSLLSDSFDRPPPSAIAPLVSAGRRYAQRIGAGALGQYGGLLDVFDDATGALIATVKVYDNARDPDTEGDVQDIYFDSMSLDDGGSLAIVDEVGRRYSVDAATLRVSLLPSTRG